MHAFCLFGAQKHISELILNVSHVFTAIANTIIQSSTRRMMHILFVEIRQNAARLIILILN